jgi:Flp pilus assembly protein TadG
MVAFSVDVGWIAASQSRLQAAADAAVQAGARQLASNFATYNSSAGSAQAGIVTSAETSAKTYAKNFAGYNKAGNVSSITLADADIEFGYTNSSGTYTKLTGTGTYPNTFKVTLRLDGTNNAALGLFFAPVLGMSSKALTATSTSVVYTSGNITGFNSSLGINGLLLPVALDVTNWNTFLATGVSPDGTTHLGPNGQPQLQVYPSPSGSSGNFGLLSTGAAASSTPSFRSWIDNGETPSDMQYLESNNLMPVSPSSPKAWSDGPGMKSTLVSNFAGIMGQPRLIPVFQPVSTSPYQGENNNGTYNIIGFVAITITEATGHGSNMNISVQAATVTDPTLIYSTVPAGEGSSTSATVLPPKLTQ